MAKKKSRRVGRIANLGGHPFCTGRGQRCFCKIDGGWRLCDRWMTGETIVPEKPVQYLDPQ